MCPNEEKRKRNYNKEIAYKADCSGRDVLIGGTGVDAVWDGKRKIAKKNSSYKSELVLHRY